jgi:hypothetical protein
MITRKKFKKSLKVLSSLSGANIKDEHFEALMAIVQYSQRFIEVEESEKEGQLKVTYKMNFKNGVPIKDILGY